MEHPFSPFPDGPVLVIGAASIDFVGRLKTDLRTGTSNPAQILGSYGGVARNIAENLARLGHPATLLAAVGEDQIGEQLLDVTEQSGVNVEFVLRSSLHPTGSYMGVLNKTGELQLALDDMRVVSLLTPEYIQEHVDLFHNASVVVVDANLSRETLRTVFSLARKAKLPVCADPTSTTLADKLLPYINRIHLLTPNCAEAGKLVGKAIKNEQTREAVQAAKQLVSDGAQIVIIAMSAFGVCYATSETNGQIPAMRTEIVDPTGAGDALTATVLFALLNDIAIDDAVRLGVSAASLTLRHRGAVLQDLSLEKLYDQLLI